MKNAWVRKSLVSAVTMGCLMGASGIGMAAEVSARDFEDVPHENWSYTAVQELIKDGVIDSYDDPTFNGQKIVTRYEMALIVRRASNKSAKLQTVKPEAKAALDKLSVEYTQELKDLGVGSIAKAPEVKETPVKKGTDLIDWSGTNFRIRYDYKKTAKTSGVTSSSGKDLFNFNFELKGRTEFAPGWNAYVFLEGNKDINGRDSAAADNLSGDFDIEQMYVTGPVGKGQIKAGRFKNQAVFGNVNKEYAQGIGYNFDLDKAKKWNLDLSWAKNDSKYYTTSPAALSTATTSTNIALGGESSLNPAYGTNIGTAVIRYKASPSTNLYGAYFYLTSSNANYRTGRVFELAATHQHSKDLTSYWDYAQSNRSVQNKMIYAALSWKKADLQKPGSYNWTLEMIHNGATATVKSNSDIKDTGFGVLKSSGIDYMNNGDTLTSQTFGQKGFDIVYSYVPVKNMRLLARYLYARPIEKSTDSSAYNLKQQFRLEMDVYFN